MTEVLANPAGVTIASGMVPWSFSPVDVVPLAKVTLSVNFRFLAKTYLLNFFLQLSQKSRLRRLLGLVEGSHRCPLLDWKTRGSWFAVGFASVNRSFATGRRNRLARFSPMVSSVVVTLFYWHHKLLFVSFWVRCSNVNADAVPQNLMAEMLLRIVLECCVILEPLRPFFPRSSFPR